MTKMPQRPPHKCNKYGCKTLTHERFCAEHRKEQRPFNGMERESASRRGYDKTWQKARLRYLRANPVCVKCGSTATVVDHIVPHRMNTLTFWNEDNWQALCAECHNKKTLREIRRD